MVQMFLSSAFYPRCSYSTLKTGAYTSPALRKSRGKGIGNCRCSYIGHTIASIPTRAPPTVTAPDVLAVTTLSRPRWFSKGAFRLQARRQTAADGKPQQFYLIGSTKAGNVYRKMRSTKAASFPVVPPCFSCKLSTYNGNRKSGECCFSPDSLSHTTQAGRAAVATCANVQPLQVPQSTMTFLRPAHRSSAGGFPPPDCFGAYGSGGRFLFQHNDILRRFCEVCAGCTELPVQPSLVSR